MEIIQPGMVCTRRRYYTGHDKPISGNNDGFYLEQGDRSLMGGRVYLCSFYAYVLANLNQELNVYEDVWLFLFDAGPQVSVQELSNPRVAIRIPAANQPDTVVYEAADGEIDEVIATATLIDCNGKPFQTSSVIKVGAFFENGVRCIVSTTELTLTPLENWGYVSKADFVTLRPSVGMVA